MSKKEADSILKITTSFLKKHGYFDGNMFGAITWTRSGMWGESKSSVSISVSTLNKDAHLRIRYTQTDTQTGEKKDFDYKIPLTTTLCRFGGKRYWFTCPWYKNGVHCGKRVGTLYKSEDYFACRHCYELTYKSKNENRRYKMFPLFKVLTLAQKIEELEKNTKRYTYGSKPTRRYKQLEKLYEQSVIGYRHYAKLERQNLL